MTDTLKLKSLAERFQGFWIRYELDGDYVRSLDADVYRNDPEAHPGELSMFRLYCMSGPSTELISSGNFYFRNMREFDEIRSAIKFITEDLCDRHQVK